VKVQGFRFSFENPGFYMQGARRHHWKRVEELSRRCATPILTASNPRCATPNPRRAPSEDAPPSGEKRGRGHRCKGRCAASGGLCVPPATACATEECRPYHLRRLGPSAQPSSRCPGSRRASSSATGAGGGRDGWGGDLLHLEDGHHRWRE
jgi:hypothetical protein